MAQWEYDKIDLSDVPARTGDLDLLNELGKEGWELVAITGTNIAYVKRQLDDAVAAQAEQPRTQPTQRRSASSRSRSS